MALSPATASLAVSLVSGVVKLGGRVDALLAEEEAVREDLSITGPVEVRLPSALAMKAALEARLDGESAPEAAPLTRAQRTRLRATLEGGASQVELFELARRHLPGRFRRTVHDPDGRFLRRLRSLRPAWGLDDPDVQEVALLVRAGSEYREADLGWRLSMVALDALAAFGSEHARLFVDDTRARPVLEAVLQNFADAEVDAATSWGGLFTRTVTATLNGVLDAGPDLRGDTGWVITVVDALGAAREGGGDDFVRGLIDGRSYPRLLEVLLARGLDRASGPATEVFQGVAAGFLDEAAPLARSSSAFESFLRERWGDALAGGLRALDAVPGAWDTEGAASGDRTRSTLHAVFGRLARAERPGALGADLVAVAVERALAVTLQSRGGPAGWSEAFGDALVRAAEHDGATRALGPEGARDLVRGALEALADRPELLAAWPEAVRDLVQGAFEADGVDPVAMAGVARSAVEVAVEVVAEHPDLADSEFAAGLGHITRSLAACVDDGVLPLVEASILGSLATEALANGREALVDGDPTLAGEALAAVTRAFHRAPGRIASTRGRVVLAEEALDALAAHGLKRLEGRTASQVGAELEAVIVAGLAWSAPHLGRGLDRRTGLEALASLVRAWGRAEAGEVDPETLVREVLA